MKKRLVLKNKYFIMLTIISIMVCFSIVFIASYAFFTTRVETKEFVIHTGELLVKYQKGNDVINLENSYPISDSDGLNTIPHTFTISNNGSIDARYLVRLELDNTINNLVPIEYIKMSYSINNSSYSDPILLSDLSSNLSFYKSNTLTVNSTDTISIKLWIDLNAPNEIQNKQFKAKIVVDSIQDVDDGFVVDTIPIIHLNKDSDDNYDLVLPVGSTYTEPGVLSVEDDKDNISVSSVNTTYQFFNGIDIIDIESINMNNAGLYYAVYTVSDSYGNIGRSVRKIIVSNDSTLPSISLKGDSSVDIYLGSIYTESGVNYDSNNRLLTFGSVDTAKLGTYIINYIVIDNKGNVNSVSRTINVIKKPIFTIVNDANSNGTADIGDEINITGTNENFYVISNDGANINALAKYNLNVGNTCTSYDSCTSIENPTGKQDASMTGYIEVNGTAIYGNGSLVFSDAVNWTAGENGIEAKATGTLHDALINYASVVTDASEVRLITKSEIETLINDGATLSSGSIKDKADAKGYSWLYSTSYWYGSANSDGASNVWVVRSYGGLGYYNFYNDFYYGVRPVITLES